MPKKDHFKPFYIESSDLTSPDFVSGKEKALPDSMQNNPAPLEGRGQDFITKHSAQVESIMQSFHQMLPSNYVSSVRGPFYTMQFQAAAEQLAHIQLMSQEVFSDSDFDFTRTEFLYQILGVLVNPNFEKEPFVLDSDLELRTFLKKMVVLLLNGSRTSTIKEGIKLITDGDISIIEKSVEKTRVPNSAYTLDDQFEFEVNLSIIKQTDTQSDHYHTVNIVNGNGKTVTTSSGDSHTHEIYNYEVLPAEDGGHTHVLVSEFSETIDKIFNNLKLIMKILKPAHTVYEFRHLFREVFSNIFSDTMSFDLTFSYYEDLRKFCEGAKEVTGVGNTLVDRSLFTDSTKNFKSIPIGSSLTILSGDNKGSYQVEDILCLPIGKEAIQRAYTTSNGLSGTLSILSNDVIEDVNQDFSSCPEDTTLTISEGGNQGTYRMEILLGSNGGKVGFTTGSSSKVKLGYSTIRLTQRMKKTISNQNYKVSVDRLGVRKPKNRNGEDISSLFYL